MKPTSPVRPSRRRSAATLLLALPGLLLLLAPPSPADAPKDGGDPNKWGLVRVEVTAKAYKDPPDPGPMRPDSNWGYSEGDFTENTGTYKFVHYSNKKFDHSISHKWTFDTPPSVLTLGQTFTLTVNGTADDKFADTQNPPNSGSDARMSAGITWKAGLIHQGDDQFQPESAPKYAGWKYAYLGARDGKIYGQASQEYTFTLPEKDPPDEFEIVFGVKQGLTWGAEFAKYHYKRGARPVGKPQPFGVRLECSQVKLVPGKLPSEVCGIYITGWKHPTTDYVEVVFDDQSSLWGDVGNGIVVFPGTTKIDPDSMVEPEYYMPIFWRARCVGTVPESLVHITVRQKGKGEVKLTQKVLVNGPPSPNCKEPDMPPPPGTNLFAGPFTTALGMLSLTLNGNKATGTFAKNGGTLTGTVKGNEFTGTFTDNTGSGVITLVLSEDGTRLGGSWVRTKGNGDNFGQLDGPTAAGPDVNPTPPNVGDAMTLVAPDLIVRKGSPVLVKVQLLNAKDVTNMDFSCTYQPDVVTGKENAEKGSLLTDIWQHKLDHPGLFKFNFAQLRPAKGSGTVAGFHFDATGPGRSKTPLTLDVHAVNNAQGDKLPIKVVNGSITIYDPADLNDPNNPDNPVNKGGVDAPQPTCSGAGKQTVADAQCCLKMWVGLTPTAMQMDLNHDGSVDSRDAVIVLQNVAKELVK